MDLAERYHVVIGNFYIATNGTIPFANAVQSIMKLWNYCDDHEVTQIKISDDSWHRADDINDHRYALINEWNLLSIITIDSKDHELIQEGNAQYYGEGNVLKIETFSCEVDNASVYIENEINE